MIRLGDLTGAILSEMAIARTRAALFAAQLAADFSDHEILRDLPIPVFQIQEAELTIPFAVARTSVPAAPPAFGGDEITRTAGQVAEALPERLPESFSLFDDQVDHWRREAVSALTEQTAADAADQSTVGGLSAAFGHLAKSHYLLGLIGQGRPVDDGPRHADLVARAASQLLRDALNEQSAQRPGPAVHIHVTADELRGLEHIATLRLLLDEGTLDRLTFTEPRETNSD
ncbi:hypothetical protein ACFYWX_39345 [Streptomyces sp. NPDC002888]|uniref:hypothetical protein n=1 Tax=Streptomyces sp. NPDC002888 TaxID=3364668 RepID=UPI0036CC5867